MPLSEEKDKKNQEIVNNMSIKDIQENIKGVLDVVFEYFGIEIAMISIRKNVDSEQHKPHFWKQERSVDAIEFWKKNGSQEYEDMEIILSYHELINKIIEKAITTQINPAYGPGF